MADLYYIESDYFTPDAGYYVYTADAGSAVTSTATMTCNAGKLQSAAVTITSAFSPTLTVDVLKNHAAVLDAVSSLSATASINRSTAVALSTIGDLNAMAARTVDITQSLTSTATISAAISYQVASSATLNSAATITTIAYNVQFASAAIRSYASLFVSRKYDRPRNLTTGTVTYSTSTKQFGTHALATGTLSGSVVSTRPTLTENWYVEGWFYVANSYVDLGWIKFGLNSLGRPYYEITMDGSVVNSFTYNVSSLGAHIAITNEYFDQLAFYVNGLRRSFGNSPSYQGGYSQYQSTTTASISGAVDEVLVTMERLFDPGISNNTASIPTSARTDTQYTKALWHLDNNGLDDYVSALTQIGAASLSSAATISVIGTTGPKLASAALTSNATINVTVGKSQTAVSSLSSAASLTALISKTLEASSSLSSTATVSPTATRIKEFASTVDALFTPTVSVNAQLAGVALLESSFTQSTLAVKTTNVVSSQSAAAALAVTPTYTLGIASNLSSAFTQSATVIRNRYADSAQTSAFTFTVDVNKIQAVSSSLTATASISISADKLVGYVINMSASAAIVTNNDRLRNVSSTQSAAFAQSTLIGSVKSASSAVTASASVSAVAVKNTNTTTTISSQFTQSAVAVKTVSAIPVLTSIATQLTAAFINATGTVLLESTATLSAAIGSIKNTTVGNKIGGIKIDNNTSPTIPHVGDDFFVITDNDYNAYGALWPSNFKSTDRFAIAFWANNATGEILTTYSSRSANISFSGNTFVFKAWSPSTQNDRRTTTWTGVPTTGWHHYILYQTSSITIANSSSSNLKLYVDGLPNNNYSVDIVANGVLDQIALYVDLGVTAGPLQWFIGLSPDQYYDVINNKTEVFDGSPSFVFNGEIYQFVAYYNTIPTEYQLRLLYNSIVPRNLGTTGTDTGLAQPNIYLRYNDYTDITNRGSLTNEIGYPTVKWREVSDLDVVDDLGNHWVQTIAHTATAADNAVIYSPGITAIATLSATSVGVYLFAVPMIGTATLNAIAYKTIGYAAALTSAANIAAIGSGVFGGSLALTAVATTSASIRKYVGYAAALSSSTTLQAVPGFFVNSAGSWTTAFTVDASVTSRPPIRTEAFLTSAAALTCSASSFSDQTVLTAGQFTLTADVTLIPPVRITANLTAITTLSATVGSVEQFAALVASAGTLTCNATKKTGALAALISTVTMIPGYKKYTGIVANWTALYATITVGEVLNLDPYYTIKVIAESRIYIPEQETRTIIVTEETRVNIIEGYTQ